MCNKNEMSMTRFLTYHHCGIVGIALKRPRLFYNISNEIHSVDMQDIDNKPTNSQIYSRVVYYFDQISTLFLIYE